MKATQRSFYASIIYLLVFNIYPIHSFCQPRQLPDLSFNTYVKKPFHKKRKPEVLFDEAHNNFHTSEGGYLPFVNLIKNDGCQVTPNKQPFTKEILQQFSVLIIVNPMGTNEYGSDPAFTIHECVVVSEWVQNGGSLLLIADHFPYGSAAKIYPSTLAYS